MCVCAFTHMHACVHMHMHMCTHMCTHMLTPAHTHSRPPVVANLSPSDPRGRFINARRRILQPMLDASNPDPAPKAKKIKSQHRPTQRFWPNSIAAGVLQQQGGAPGTNPDGKDWAEGTLDPGVGGWQGGS